MIRIAAGLPLGDAAARSREDPGGLGSSELGQAAHQQALGEPGEEEGLGGCRWR